MCFSAQADLIGGVVVSAIGVDALRHVQTPRQLPVASLPLLLGGHLLIETSVWWGLEGRTSADLGAVAMWAYLLIAFVVLPAFVPLAILAIEPQPSRRALLGVLAALGAGVGLTLLAAMVRGPVDVRLHAHHLTYDVGLPDGLFIVTLYVIATCGALLVSSNRHIVVFGAINLPVVALLALLNSSGFASLWCAWAAVASALIAAYLRSTSAREDRTVLRTTPGVEA